MSQILPFSLLFYPVQIVIWKDQEWCGAVFVCQHKANHDKIWLNLAKLPICNGESQCEPAEAVSMWIILFCISFTLSAFNVGQN